MIRFTIDDIATPGANIDDADVWAVIKLCEPQDLSVKFRYMQYGQYLRTPYWRAVARAHKLRAGMRCQLCGSTERLESHHVVYTHRGNEHLHPADLTCLCHEHHEKYERERMGKKPATHQPKKKHGKSKSVTQWKSWEQMDRRGGGRGRGRWLKGVMS